MSLYNLSVFYDAANPLEMVLAINDVTSGIFGSALYVVLGLGIMVAIFYSTNDVNQSLGIGGFLGGVIGAPLALVSIIPIYFPFIFFTFAMVGVVLRVSGGRAE